MIFAVAICSLAFAFLSTSLPQKEPHCSDNLDCLCYNLKEDFVANCSGLNLTSFPGFIDSVTAIDFRFNAIVAFPHSFSSNVRYLDVSYNRISEYSATSSCCEYLEVLKMDYNFMGNGSAFRVLFQNLPSLYFLSMKGNTERSDLERFRYPDKLLSPMAELNTLHIDGYVSANIGDLFSDNNNLTFLDISGFQKTCVLHFVTKEMFSKLSKLRFLSVSYCSIRVVEMGAFQNLRFLEQLDISNNDELTLETIPNITHNINPGITFLNFEKLQCTIGTSRVLRKIHVRNLQNTSLEKLNIASNRIAYLEVGLTKLIPKTLKHVNAGDNVMSNELYVFELHHLEGLEILNISYQFRTHQMFPDFFRSCHDDNVKTPPKEQNQLVLRPERNGNGQLGKNSNSNVVQNFIITLYFPPMLKVLYVEHTQYTLSITIPVIANNSQVTHVYGNNNLFMTAFYPIYSINKLEYLDLSHNLLTNITANMFIDCSSLIFLNLSYNMFGNVLASPKSNTMFHYMTNLEVLDLSANGITKLWPEIFKSFGKLEHLNVSLNKIGNWVVRMDYMKHLISFDVSYNEISVFDRETMDVLEFLSSFNPILINFAGNPLMCSCENLPFLNWLHSLIPSKHILFHHLWEYKCLFSNGSAAKIGNIHGFIRQLQSECRAYPIITLVCTFCITLFLGVSIGKVLHRYRWSLRYWYYVARGTKKRFKRENVFYYRYDAFISYDEEDRDTALEIANILENKKHLKCCLPERDFMPGTNMYDNIINSIHVSRKIVCMLSKNYMNSQWSMIEFQIAQMDSVLSKSRKDKNILLGVILETRPHLECMNKTILNLLESDSCITYSNETNAQFVCLEKLCDML